MHFRALSHGLLRADPSVSEVDFWDLFVFQRAYSDFGEWTPILTRKRTLLISDASMRCWCYRLHRLPVRKVKALLIGVLEEGKRVWIARLR